MTPDLIVFFVLALAAVTTALGMLLNKNAVYSALFLILNFATVAIFYLWLGAPFIAMVQVTVYGGAIMVLFLFVIMLLGAERLGGADTADWQKPAAVVLALILIAEATYIVFGRTGGMPLIATPEAGYASPAVIGLELFQEYFLPFQVTAILLLAAMIGAIVLTKVPKKQKKVS
jgi:NADH-quinone oxidoreductase subunit J